MTSEPSNPILSRITSVVRQVLSTRVARWIPRKIKRAWELRYWKNRAAFGRDLAHDHFRHFFTVHFGLTADDYENKRVLDVGCGPRGSLEWADVAARRIGVDPLSYRYRSLGTSRHGMSYVAGTAGSLPFQTAYFDVVASFNALDHVDDLRGAVAEIVRVLKPDGILLLLVDVNHAPTLLEPIVLDWEAPRLFAPQLDAVRVRHYEKIGGMYESIRAGVAYDHADSRARPGILSALLRKH